MNVNTIEHIQQYPAIPVYYNDDPEICTQVLQACYDGGIRVFEFTNRGDKAPDNFKTMVKYRDENLPDLLLGIGTIKNTTQAGQYILLGADFLVSPIIKEDISKLAFKHQKLWIPGCMTPTEINYAEELGAPLIKLFPGDTLGPGFLKAIKPLFPKLKFMPTGGVDITKESIDNWLNAGVSAIGFGSKLFVKPDTENGYKWLTENCRHLMKLVYRK